MIRVNVVAEGQSEMWFVKKALSKYFGGNPLVDSRCVMTGKDSKTNYEYRGGLLKYKHAKRDILRWFKEDSAAYITTMFDFFRLPVDFPGYEAAMGCKNHRESVRVLEESLKTVMPEDINHGEETAPSKRLLHAIDYRKGESLWELLDMIGIPVIRKKCPHFSEWIDKLQRLPEI